MLYLKASSSLFWRFLGFILASGSFKEHVIMEMIGLVDEPEGEEKQHSGNRGCFSSNLSSNTHSQKEQGNR